MTTDEKIHKSAFNFLDAYQEEAFCWAEKVWSKINQRFDSNSFDIEIISIAFASIYNDFLHVSLGYPSSDFESHLAELYGEKKDNEKFKLMYDCRKQIYEAMSSEYSSNDNVYESLKESVFIKDDQEGSHNNPMSDTQELKAMSFVDNGFNY